VNANIKSTLYGNNPMRFFALLAVFVFNIHCMLPFVLLEDPLVRLLFSTVCDQIFKGAKVYARKAKHHIIEMYAYARGRITSTINDSADLKLGLPPIALSLDFWTSNINKKKFMGA
jgi:hypothetical protein